MISDEISRVCEGTVSQYPKRIDGLEPGQPDSGGVASPARRAKADAPYDEGRRDPDAVEHDGGDEVLFCG